MRLAGKASQLFAPSFRIHLHGQLGVNRVLTYMPKTELTLALAFTLRVIIPEAELCVT